MTELINRNKARKDRARLLPVAHDCQDRVVAGGGCDIQQAMRGVHWSRLSGASRAPTTPASIRAQLSPWSGRGTRRGLHVGLIAGGDAAETAPLSAAVNTPSPIGRR